MDRFLLYRVWWPATAFAREPPPVSCSLRPIFSNANSECAQNENLLPPLPKGLTEFGADHNGTPQSFARRIMNESVEVAAAFDAAGKMVVRPREGGVNHVSFGPSEPLNDVVVIHNHPQGGSPSTDDFIFAVERNLKGFKVVLPTGVVYSCDRPTAGWPSSDNMEYELEKIYDALVQFRSERYTLSRRNVSESEVQEFLSAQRVSCLKSIGVELKKGDVFTW